MLVALLAVISVANLASADSEADAYAAEGDKYFRARDYFDAVEAYKRAVALDPSLGLAYYGLALSYHQQQQWVLAIPNWRRARLLLEPEAAMLLVMGNDYFQLKQYDAALEAFQSAVRLQPPSVDLMMADYWLGVTYNQIGQPEKAVTPLREALHAKPDDPDFNFEMGNAYYSLKQYTDAVPLLKEAIRLRPELAMAYYNLGLVYLAMHKREDALETYSKLQAIDKAKAQELHSKIDDQARQDISRSKSAY
ncbi:MAG: tetratricopeptide repeat protein [Candidatus Korobacteraceae bacterium]